MNKIKWVCTNKPGTAKPGYRMYEAKCFGYIFTIEENGFFKYTEKHNPEITANYNIYRSNKLIEYTIFSMPTWYIMKKIQKDYPKSESSPEIKSSGICIINNFRIMLKKRSQKKNDSDRRIICEILDLTKSIKEKLSQLED